MSKTYHAHIGVSKGAQGRLVHRMVGRFVNENGLGSVNLAQQLDPEPGSAAGWYGFIFDVKSPDVLNQIIDWIDAEGLLESVHTVDLDIDEDDKTLERRRLYPSTGSDV